MQIKPHFRLERQPKQVIIQVVIHICLELIGCCDIDNNLVVVIIKKSMFCSVQNYTIFSSIKLKHENKHKTL